MQTVDRQGYIPTLDGWRAIAISLVVGAHSFVALSGVHTWLTRALAAIFAHVSFGVDVFFALSGYLICTLLLRERGRAGRIALSRFYVRRAFRILPPVMVYLLALVVLRAAHLLPEIRFWDLISVLVLARNYVHGSLYTGHFWSLAVEEHFYLFVPLLLSRLRWRAALFTSLTLGAASIAVRAIEYRGISTPGAIYFRTESRLDALMYGAALALLLSRPAIRAWIARHLSSWVMLALTLSSAALLSASQSQPVRRSLIAFVLPLFVVYTVLRPRSPLGRVLEMPAMRWLGRLSFSMYIWQEMFLVHEGQPLGWLQAYPGNLIATLLCAIASYYWVEKPFYRIGHRLAGRGSPIAPSNERPAVTPPEIATGFFAIRELPSDPPRIH